jgi:uncharacterized membrane protein
VLFPREISERCPKQFEAVERIVLNISMSIAIVTIVGSFIYYVSGVLNFFLTVFCLILITVVFATLVVVRDYYMYEKSQKTFFNRFFS